MYSLSVMQANNLVNVHINYGIRYNLGLLQNCLNFFSFGVDQEIVLTFFLFHINLKLRQCSIQPLSCYNTGVTYSVMQIIPIYVAAADKIPAILSYRNHCINKCFATWSKIFFSNL